MSKKIILNYMPPADTDMPSAALSILKSFMITNGYETEIKYWNLLINKFLFDSDSSFTATTQVRLLPFGYIFSEQHNDKDALSRIKINLQSLKPSWILKGKSYYVDWLEETKTKIYQVITEELDKIDFENVLIIGLSSKFYQWIPGMILAEEIKKRNSEIKIIIGGFESNNGATEILEICPFIDYAVWGEGEYTLLEICKQIESGKYNLDSVPRTAYREKETIKLSTNTRSQYLDFEQYVYPDFDDFVKQSGRNPTRIPINSIRGCPWKKCMFCNYSHGYKYRERTPESLLDEIKYMYKKYGTDYFIFVDNDIIGHKLSRFENLLDLLIDYKTKENKQVSFWGEFIIHPDFDMNIYQKLSLAGFLQVSAGYEAISESILKKMNKKNSLAHNILLIKGLQKAGVKCPVNLIKGVPDETESDVIESINNLHCFRFYFSDSESPLNHILGFFNLKKEARYFNQLTEDERKAYDNNSIAANLPNSFVKNKFYLFGYNKNAVTNEKLWNDYSNIENHYLTNKYSYSITKEDESYIYTEFINKIEISSFTFFESEYIETLKFCNNSVQSFEILYNHLKEKYPEIETDKLQEILYNLEAEYLIYYNEGYKDIITIIDMI